METNNVRLEYMDWLKGLAMFLVVAGHGLLGMYESGAFPQEEKVLFIATEIIYSFHMPIFFMVAGFFYGRKQLGKADVLPFLKRKLRSFGIPYLIFAILQIAMQYFGGASVRTTITLKSVLLLFVRPVDHLWFLWAIFLCFLVSVLLDVLIKNVNVVFGICILLAILSVGINCENPVLEYILEYPFFFYLGKIIWKYQLKLDKWNKWVTILIGFLLLAGTNSYSALA